MSAGNIMNLGQKRRLMPKADLVVYRNQSGAALVSPGTLIASKKEKFVYVLNCTNEVVKIGIPARSIKASGKLMPRRKGAVDISKVPKGCYLYIVQVGTDYAEGNSPPRIIIDD